MIRQAHAKRWMLGGAIVALSAVVLAPAGLAMPRAASVDAPAFAVSFTTGAHNGPLTGRVLVIVSTKSQPEPRFQAGSVTDSTPFWGIDVTNLTPGQQVVLDTSANVYGYPLPSLNQLPAGDYYVQALLNVYTTFHHADGSVVALHLPCGDGNNMFISPGNLISDVQHVHIDAGSHVNLVLDRALPPLQPVPPGGTCQQGNPPDSAHVKHIKILSPLLSRFWGQPMYIAADLLLPQGYDDAANAVVRYPVIWNQDHFPTGNPFGFSEKLDNPFSRWWVSNEAPRLIAIDIRHETPYYDDSYAVNSANVGPYGDAITGELMPAVAQHFRVIDATWARTLTGGSTGGWEAIAQQVFYPRLYAGAWIFYPDPVDFRFFQLINIYSDPNAYVNAHAWLDVPRPAARTVSGDSVWDMAQENHWELALGDHGRSGLGQWDVWQAVFGPEGSDGYPAPIWDKLNGTIDHTVAGAWQAKDLRMYLQSNWPTVGPLLSGKLHVFVGDADTFFLNDAVHLLQEGLADVSNPPANAQFMYGDNQPHGWSPYTTPQLLTLMADYMADHAPPGSDTAAWLPPSVAAQPIVPGSYQLIPPPTSGRLG